MGPDRLLEAHSPVAVDLDGVVTLRMEESGLGSRPPVSCYSALHSAAQRWPGNTAWVHQDKKWNYEEYFHQVTDSLYTASAKSTTTCMANIYVFKVVRQKIYPSPYPSNLSGPSCTQVSQVPFPN